MGNNLNFKCILNYVKLLMFVKFSIMHEIMLLIMIVFYYKKMVLPFRYPKKDNIYQHLLQNDTQCFCPVILI